MAVLALVVACGGGGSGEEARSSDEQASDAPAADDGAGQPDAGEAGDAEVPTVEGAPDGLVVTDLVPALLTEEEVGRGYTVDHEELTGVPEPGESEGDPEQEAAAQEACPDLMALGYPSETPSIRRRLTDDVEAEVEHEISVVPPEQMGPLTALDGMRCTLPAANDQPGSVGIGVDLVDGPGQAALAVTMTWDSPEVFAGETYALVVLRRGVSSAVWVQGELGADDQGVLTRAPADRDLAHELAAVADAKVAAIVG